VKERDLMQEYEHLKQLIEQVAEDLAKAEGGNKNAGTRVRKVMQEIRQSAQNIRVKILELRGQEQPAEPDEVGSNPQG
jgi:predicted  nucleic acid-binding Zn-ribbon protein